MLPRQATLLPIFIAVANSALNLIEIGLYNKSRVKHELLKALIKTPVRQSINYSIHSRYKDSEVQNQQMMHMMRRKQTHIISCQETDRPSPARQKMKKAAQPTYFRTYVPPLLRRTTRIGCRNRGKLRDK
ncbi:hypothetical protein F5Y16DRAFT_187915 [Xylariaceae sp. FL0255]|nr:hypothetical protein F5Y16DRAFT_187915 [Xylariaceae sp. FL0255]